jgi:DNA polymerase-1
MPKPEPVLYLIDASSYVYRAFFALPPLTSPSGLLTNAVYGVTTMLLKLLRETTPLYLGAVFDAPGPTFRDELFDDYKANRPAMPDDLAAQFPLVHEIVAAFSIHQLSVAGVEADDVIGTIAARMAARGIDTVVLTGDKDLMQLVGEHVRLWDTMRDRWIDSEAVRERFGVRPEQVIDIMGLMGDPIDNIPGIKGIGEKTATALVRRFGTIEHLLERLDELESAADIRGARKLAATLRANAATARLSRELAVVRRDVPLQCELETFRYPGPNREALRAAFTRFGFQSLLKELAASQASVAVPVHHAEDAADIAALAEAARRCGRIALACAGTYERGTAQLASLLLTTDGAPPLCVPLGADERVPEAVAGLLEDEGVEKVAHDWKRDLLLLSVRSEGATKPAFDVMVASYLLEASATHRLEDLAADLLGVSLPAFRDGVDSLGNGVSLLLGLRDRFAAQVRAAQMERLFHEVEMPLVPILARMEQRGVRLDVAALADMGNEMERRLAALTHEIYTLAGGEFNIGSPIQLREVLFERLGLSRRGVRRGKTGLSTDVDVLTRLAAAHPLPAKILEHRALAKLKSTYVDALPAAVNLVSGRLHTSFNQTVTATGRLSSSDPNLQNIPVRGADGRRIRAAFIAADGCRLLVADYSQIELRVLAHLSGDAVLVAAFQAGDDVHARTAAEIFGVLPATVSPDMRRVAKVINFGIIYGMGAPRLARELGIGVGQAEGYIAQYFARYNGVRAYLDATRETARMRGYVTTLLGRRRSLPDLVSPDRRIAQAAERIAVNTPIQGSAADLIKMAMVAVDRRLAAEHLRAVMILQVHDELVFEVCEEDCEQAAAAVREEMEAVGSLRVPLRVDLGMGRTWAEAH